MFSHSESRQTILLRAAGMIFARWFLREQHRRARIFQHEFQPVLRIIRIKWNIGSARFENSKNGDHHFERTFHADGHERFRANARVVQIPRKLIGAFVQFAIRELLVFANDSDGVWTFLDLLLEQRWNAVNRRASRRNFTS